MKARRVLLTIEVETDIPLQSLKSTDTLELWCTDRKAEICGYIEIHQAQANVIKPAKKKLSRAGDQKAKK